MESVPGHFLKRTIDRVAAILSPREINIMNSVEFETSGLQEKSSGSKAPILPDGSQPIPLGSGVISGILGEGGAAVLYEIRNAQLGFQRAVKLLKPTNTRESYERFLREFRISAQLNHPNIVVVHSLGQWQKLPFIEMEKITGYTLNEISSQFGPLQPGLCTAIGILVCKAIEYLHSCKFELNKNEYHGLLHLDLKPSNIILSDSGTVKIMDFGLATPIDNASAGKQPLNIGSSQYSAPELFFGTEAPGIGSDLYSLGCILYELASGARVFNGATANEVMNDRKNNKHIHLKKLDHSLPSDYIDIVERCLSFEKNERPGDVQTIRRRLEALHTKCTSLTPESTVLLYVNQRKQNEPFTLPKPLHPVRTVVIFTTVGIITASAVFIISNNKFRAQYLSTFIPQVSATVTKPDIIPENLVITPKINLLTDETDDFYAPETDTTQASLMHALRREWTARRYDQMLKVIEQMPAELAASKEVILYRFRSLGRGGEELGVLLKEVNISDGEFYFHKARYLFGNKDYVTALENLIRAESLPSEFLDKRILGREVQLYKARSLTALFRSDPTSENLTIAMQSWNKLLQLVKDYPGSLHNKEAEREKENLVAEATWRGISIAESN